MDATPSIRTPLSRTTRLLALVAVLVALIAVAVPAAAHAGAYAVEQAVPESCGNGTRGGGQMDASGWLYVACDRSDKNAVYYSVHILDPSGVLQRMAPVPWPIMDVAPSPDGSVLYVTRWSDHTVYRLTGSRGAGYALDATWKLENLPLGDVRNAGLLVRGEYVSTDAAGDLYVASGTWTNPENRLADYTDRWNPTRTATRVAKTIVKFHADGAYVTNFGGAANMATDTNVWDRGIAWAQWTGLAVTADGGRVFVADENNSRIHRFDRQGAVYVAQTAFGNTPQTNAARDGHCYTPGLLAAPYDIAMSRGGELLVINTSCYYSANMEVVQSGAVPVGSIEVQRFNQNGGSRGVIFAKSGVGDVRVHGISIDCTGVIHLPQAGIKVLPAATWSDSGADVGGGGPLGSAATNASCTSPGAPVGDIPGSPDTAAPIVDSLGAPQNGTDLTMTLTTVAHDDRGITEMRVYEDDTDLGWSAWTPAKQHTVSGYGNHYVSVQVRDAAGNTSAWTSLWVKVVLPAPVPVQPPVNSPAHPSVTAPHVTAATPKAAPKVANTSSPMITAVKLPPSTTTKRITATVKARDPEGGALYVRFAGENGRWGRLRKLGKVAVPLSRGIGWKGVFVQVVDAQGNRSRVWFQAVLSAPRSASWVRGSVRNDRLKGSARADYIDLSRFDGRVDRVHCGRGVDTVLLQREDIAAKDCERVVRLKMPVS
jgi:hypothetical protein